MTAPACAGAREASAPRCPLCGSGAAFQRALPHASARRCTARACGLRFADPQPDDAALREAYRALYYPDAAEVAAGHVDRACQVDWDETPPGTLEELVADVARRLGARPGARMLDYGCGRGALARVAIAAGLDAVGVELDGEARRAAVDAGVRAWPDLAALRCAEPAARFDVVTVWQVVEHLRRPWEDLAALRELLTPDGFLVIATPNAACLRARIEGARWENVTNPTHLYYFTDASLGRLLARAGLAPVDRLHLPAVYPHHGFLRRRLQDALRAGRLDGDLVFVARPRRAAAAG